MRPKTVICGSYRRDPAGLSRLFRELEATGCRVLSPLSLDFKDARSGVARLDSEQDFSAGELEKYHLRAINEADFVWIHAPDGYIGLSTAFEIGYCKALNKPVFTREEIKDEMLKTQITKSGSVFESLEILGSSSLAHES